MDVLKKNNKKMKSVVELLDFGEQFGNINFAIILTLNYNSWDTFLYCTLTNHVKFGKTSIRY